MKYFYSAVICILTAMFLTWIIGRISKSLYKYNKTKQIAVNFFKSLISILLWFIIANIYLLQFQGFRDIVGGLMTGSGLNHCSIRFHLSGGDSRCRSRSSDYIF